MVLNTVLDLGKTRICLKLRLLHDIAEQSVQLIISCRNYDISILCREYIVRIGGFITVTDSLRNAACSLIDHGDIFHCRCNRIDQCHINLLSKSCLLLIDQCR